MNLCSYKTCAESPMKRKPFGDLLPTGNLILIIYMQKAFRGHQSTKDVKDLPIKIF